MAIEIERKFLVDSERLALPASGKRYRQGYLPAAGETSVRVHSSATASPVFPSDTMNANAPARGPASTVEMASRMLVALRMISFSRTVNATPSTATSVEKRKCPPRVIPRSFMQVLHLMSPAEVLRT